MVDLEAWIKMLFQYGPFALIVLLIFVAEKKARKAWQQTANEQGRIPLMAVYCGLWFIVLGLIVFAAFTWYQLNLRTEATVHGSFENLRGSETITSRSAPLYLLRKYDKKGVFDYDWRLITPAKLPDSARISFTFDRSKPDSEFVTDHELIIRRDARKELAEFGADALPWLQETLARPNRNYRVTLGLIITLNKMGEIADLRNAPQALATIARATLHRDPTLSRQARLYVQRHPSREVARALAAERDRLTSATHFVLANAPPNKAVLNLVRLQFDTLCKTGTAEIEAYVESGRAQGRVIERSISAFQEAWALRPSAPRDQRVYYLQALYGWGRALHERSMDGPRRDNRTVDLARRKFAQFLRELGKLENRSDYPVQQQIENATAYLKKPVSRSLKRS